MVFHIAVLIHGGIHLHYNLSRSTGGHYTLVRLMYVIEIKGGIYDGLDRP